MTTPIKPIGNMFKTDANGYLVNESSPAKVKPPWDAAVAYAKQTYLDHFTDFVHSIYLVGSVSRGMGIKGVSDIDTFAVLYNTKEDLAQFDQSWMPDVQRDFRLKFPFATHLDLNIVPLQDVMHGREMHYGIKVRGFCLYGEDLAPRIPPFKPDIDLACYLQPPLLEMLIDFEIDLEITDDPHERVNLCRSMLKWIVRCGMLLVIERERAHTLDLYPSYVAFSKHYPHQEAHMRRILELAINPVSNVEQYWPFIRTFGEWLDEEMIRRLGHPSSS